MSTNDFGLPVSLPGAKASTRIWSPLHEVEQDAQTQIRNTAALPWVHGVAVMPDVHTGYGVTIGSVIAMNQAVSPSAVGVDIGCLDAETEFLSPDGWVRIDQWDGQQVLGFDPETDEAVFVQPQRYIVKDCDEFYWFKNSKGLNQMLSADHRMLVYRGHKNRGYDHEVIDPVELTSRSLDKGYYTFKAAFTSGQTDIDISDEMIRVEVMVQADGRVRQLKNGRSFVELHFRRERKIERAAKLLREAGIDFSQNTWADGTTSFGFSIEPEHATKSFDHYWTASARQLSIVADEVLNWDGHRGYRSHFTSKDKNAVDLIQYAFAATGIRGSISFIPRQKPHHSDLHMVVPTKNPMVGYAQPTIVPSKDGKMYCFIVDTSFFVARRGDHIFVTGNCGMNAVKTSLTIDDLPDDLASIRRQLEAVTPVGFNAYDGTAPVLKRESKLSARFDNLFSGFADLRADGIDERQGKALSQCGTLGGGNHFQELCVDGDGSVWLMLHSGSRNIGKELAERHIAKAKDLEWNSDLPDRNLAVFLHKDADGHVYDEWTDYLHDLYWAQDYAALSRQIMMASFKDVVRTAIPQVTFEDEISCHHNYVSEETYDGHDLVITRKGAIAAHAGKLGVIPGSMGTGSFIVRGLGNEQSYCSASHGAGRKMSRGKAKKVFTVDDLAAQTAGVECRKDAGVLDEIPGAYKDLNQVIAYESDLVEPVARLETLLCVKG